MLGRTNRLELVVVSGRPEHGGDVHVGATVLRWGRDTRKYEYDSWLHSNLYPHVRLALAGDAAALQKLFATYGLSRYCTLACTDGSPGYNYSTSGPYRLLVRAQGSVGGGQTVDYAHPLIPLDLVTLLHDRYAKYEGLSGSDADTQRSEIRSALQLPYRQALLQAAEAQRRQVAGLAVHDREVIELTRHMNEAAKALAAQQNVIIRELTV
ncbi:MAG TPA: hypothetical protein VLF67_04965 [Candidatus Saccharimonas sp.]|nr:hypothetical protein [Candidatus Saccharimonas sp.]